MKLGYAICGSFCTVPTSIRILKKLTEDGHTVVPIMSLNAGKTDTRFGTAEEVRRQVVDLCGRKIVETLTDAEPLGPREPLDALLVCPCTGNTLAKLANGITDTPVTLAVKAHLREDRPLVIALASNDAMSANLGNIGTMLNRKNVFFVPMKQDDLIKKPHSLVFEESLVPDALGNAMQNRQTYPLFR